MSLHLACRGSVFCGGDKREFYLFWFSRRQEIVKREVKVIERDSMSYDPNSNCKIVSETL